MVNNLVAGHLSGKSVGGEIEGISKELSRAKPTDGGTTLQVTNTIESSATRNHVEMLVIFSLSLLNEVRAENPHHLSEIFPCSSEKIPGTCPELMPLLVQEPIC